MKKVISILAVAVLSMVLFSCEAENNVEETEALYENLDDTKANDDDSAESEDRGN